VLATTCWRSRTFIRRITQHAITARRGQSCSAALREARRRVRGLDQHLFLRPGRSVRGVQIISFNGRAVAQLTDAGMRAKHHGGSCIEEGGRSTDRAEGVVGEHTCRHGQRRARSAKQANQEHKNSARTCISPQEGCARALQTEDRTHTTPRRRHRHSPLHEQPTLRINDDNDYDDVDHDDNGAATNDDSAHYKQADTTHN